ncbi:hypothetical protein FQA39_LY11461 [Lamprigera yunnana]|nr:hypothetical protein FQA39_LY11461 [Lamprigera yunnana]
MTVWDKIVRNGIIFSSKIKIISRQIVTAQATGTKNALRLSLIGAGIGAVIGTGYSVYKLNVPHRHIMNTETTIATISNAPDIVPSRQIVMPGDQSGLKLTLYQYQTCPFCCKVRAFLDYHGISYDVVEVDPVLRQSIKWSPYKKVPILLAKVKDGYQPLNDSSMIISTIASYLQEPNKDLQEIVKCYPFLKYIDENGSSKSEVMNKYFLMLDQKNTTDSKEVLEERKWRKWTDDILVHTLSPNVYRTREEALQAFNWFSEVGEWEKHFPTWERYLIIYVGAFAMWMIGKRLKTRHQLKDDVRTSLYDECDRFVKAIRSKGTTFLGGSQPNLADLSVYGILNSIEGCIAFQDLLSNTNIKDWYFSMKAAVRKHQGALY